jgi:hypothetical protein
MLNQKLLTLSDLRVIGPKHINPQSAEAEQRAEIYCRNLGIWLPHLQEYTTMSAYLHPHASVERLTAIIILNNLLYYIDDIHSSDRSNAEEGDDLVMMEIYRNCMALLYLGQMPADRNPLYDTCKVIRDLVLDLSSEDWLRRLAMSLKDHLQATTLSIQEIMVDGVLDVNRYIELRELDSGMHPTIDMIELGLDMFLPNEVIHHPQIETLRICTIRLGGLVNDLFSYHKEVILSGQRFNLVNVLMENRGCRFEEAVNECVLMLNQYSDTFVATEQELPDFGDDDLNYCVQLYVRGLRDQILATYHWQMSTNRYRSPDSPFPELRVLLQ